MIKAEQICRLAALFLLVGCIAQPAEASGQNSSCPNVDEEGIVVYAFHSIWAYAFSGCPIHFTTEEAGAEEEVAAAPEAALAPEMPAPQAAILPGSIEDFMTNVGDTVHFDVDQSVILDQDKATLQRQADWLNKYPDVHVLIQGFADDPGTHEHNLDLGARRAGAIKDYLVSLGISAARIDTVSLGNDHPICSETAQDCTAMNRRAVTNIPNGPNGGQAQAAQPAAGPSP